MDPFGDVQHDRYLQKEVTKLLIKGPFKRVIYRLTVMIKVVVKVILENFKQVTHHQTKDGKLYTDKH